MSKMMSMLSNVMKKVSDTSNGITQNLMRMPNVVQRAVRRGRYTFSRLLQGERRHAATWVASRSAAGSAGHRFRRRARRAAVSCVCGARPPILQDLDIAHLLDIAEQQAAGEQEQRGAVLRPGDIDGQFAGIEPLAAPELGQSEAVFVVADEHEGAMARRFRGSDLDVETVRGQLTQQRGSTRIAASHLGNLNARLCRSRSRTRRG